ncbi:DUF4169 family protein [Aliiroseovarius sp. KMU-50]|uniref:DUF4169 family protein n=1 Tax=Aliiroseovarius salicola TaxID=3009082 RepID=A0ABT4W2E3_9RHOB|nr:DUF4169 family protein [Aliiroseovarius sp. KMU-50]MDA5094696.1 DUF4169 family protein [Aliiroseovarius sp. KMU-50]
MDDKVINLRQRRKQAQRRDKARQADENAVKFGRSKAEKMLDAAQNEKSERDLNAHKREDDR